MAQFDVFRLSGGELVLDVQTDLLGAFDSRVVVPLYPPELAPVRHKRLNPEVTIDGRPYVLVTQFLIAIDRPELGFRIDNLDRHYDEIKAAYDMLLNGF
ncbi:MAG: putative CcdB-like protein [Devosia sp.]|uniref:CcdB family protein n=1 Tax=Devosia sp. TaxID=1871048 RepID=UPI00262ABD94|nr:CcdB family protein [Devosia sp.]MDB5540054.1 putative CcdB-like protein [Devosia sp.]